MQLSSGHQSIIENIFILTERYQLFTHMQPYVTCQMLSLVCEARSLGSVALRKAENVEGGLHFNVFTVDFNEELVALYGGSLLRQTHFLHESVKAILRLYKVRPQTSATCHTRLRTLDIADGVLCQCCMSHTIRIPSSSAFMFVDI